MTTNKNTKSNNNKTQKNMSSKQNKTSENLMTNNKNQQQKSEENKQNKGVKISDSGQKTNNLNKDDKTENTEEKNKKIVISKTTKYGFISALIILAVLLVSSIVINFFQLVEYKKLQEEGVHTLLNVAEINVVENGSNSVGVSLLNDIISSVTYPQLVKMKSGVLNNAQVVRAKAMLINCDGEFYSVELGELNNWVEGADGYKYFNGVIDSSTEFIVSQQITLPEKFSSNNNNHNSHVLIVTIECLDFNNAVASKVWTTAPTEWLLEFGSGETVL